MYAYFFFISLKYVFPFIFYLSGGKTYQPALVYTAWFRKMDSMLYIYISWTIHGMWMIYITFEREDPYFLITIARMLS